MLKVEKNCLFFFEGMRDSGGHGGGSFAETNVPLIFIGPPCQQSHNSYKQIDIAPTLSVLFGRPIPVDSIGSLIPEFLTQLTPEQKLYAYFYNCQRLFRKIFDIDHDLFRQGNPSCVISRHVSLPP